MFKFTALISRLGFALARRRLDREASYEFDEHLHLLTERYIRQGLSQEDARAAARRQFGNVILAREEIHHMNGIAWVDGLVKDSRSAVRQLRRSPGYSAAIIATLGLGIGATTAVFSVVHAVLLAPLPYEEPGQLVRLYQQEPAKPDTRGFLAGPQFTFIRDHAASFEDVAGVYTLSEAGLDLASGGRAHRLRVLRVTSDYFSTLRLRTSRGPGFDRRDDTGTRRTILSDEVWRRYFGGDPAVVGRTIQLSAEPYEVVGTAAPGLRDPIIGPVDAWVPYNLARDGDPENSALSAIGRLRNGVSMSQARAELATLAQSVKERWPQVSRSAIAAVPLHEDQVAMARGPLRLLIVAAGVVLLLACVNVANLVLVRASGRVQEFAVRSALGSGRMRLVRQLLIESLFLAALGGVVGLTLAQTGIRVLQRLGAASVPRLDEIGFDLPVLGFALLTTVITALTFSLAPAFRLAGTSPGEVLSLALRSYIVTGRQKWFRNGLATAQFALALTLLVGAGALLASFYRLLQVDLGFRVERVLTFELNLPAARYDDARRAAFQEEVARTLRSIPGVTAAGGVSRLPATGSYHPWNTLVMSGPLNGTMIGRTTGFTIQQRTVSGEFLAALDIPLRAGRVFDSRDDPSAPPRAVVSTNFARRAFPGMPLEAIASGQRIRAGGRVLEIIGVVGDVALDVYGTETLVVYHAHRQFANDRNWALTQVVAADVAPERLVGQVHAAIAALDPELVVHRVAPMSEVVGRETSRERFTLVLMSTFAVVSVLLAALGLYGVLTYMVRQRSHEMGIRMALGASGGQVRALVVRQAASILGISVMVGIAGALGLTRLLSSLVFEISPSDPRIIMATVLLLTITGLIAAWLPARRASRVEPRLAMQGHI